MAASLAEIRKAAKWLRRKSRKPHLVGIHRKAKSRRVQLSAAGKTVGATARKGIGGVGKKWTGR